MYRLFFRSLSYPLAVLGLILGFTSKVLAQYGAWVASYKYMGNVKSDICQNAVPGLKVTLENENQQPISETFTNDSGRFNIRYYSDYDASEKIYLKITDVDGVQNGTFYPFTQELNNSYLDDIQIKLSHIGKAPCEEIIEPDTSSSLSDNNIADIEPQTSDSLIIGNEDPGAVLSNNMPIIPEPIFDIFVYPNPSTGYFTISFTLTQDTDISVALYNSTAQLVFAESFTAGCGIQTRSFNTPHLASGNYILTFRTKASFITKNIIIKP